MGKTFFDFLSTLSTDWYHTIADLENAISCASIDFYRSKQLSTLHLPITTGAIISPMGLGSRSLPVKIKLFGQETYLADSMQFFLEYGCRLHSTGCYYIMPSFRGEDADNRHLCQFYHSEAEIPGTITDVMQFVEEYLRYLCKYILENCANVVLKQTGSLFTLKK